MTSSMSSGTDVQLGRRYLRAPSPTFFPSEEEVPETSVHLRLRTALFLVLDRELRGRAFVGSDQFVYWDPTDATACVAPDVVVRLGGPLELVRSIKVWEHGAPHLAVEIVSEADSRDRDFDEKLERYRRAGIAEVVRFDADDSVTPLRLFDFVEGDLVERDRSDPEAYRCDVLSAYWTLVRDEALGLTLRVARDRAGLELWPTPEEGERAALERVAELERKLGER